jgi:pilus assembly protein FimV
MLPDFDGATLDQTMIALFKANPDAFASGATLTFYLQAQS